MHGSQVAANLLELQEFVGFEHHREQNLIGGGHHATLVRAGVLDEDRAGLLP